MQRYTNLFVLLSLLFFFIDSVRFLQRERHRSDLVWRRAMRVLARLLGLATILIPWVSPLTFRIAPYPTGPNHIRTVSIRITDTHRRDPYTNDDSYRWLPVTIWYPIDTTVMPQSCPLILFSHGSFGVKESNAFLCQELASYGYVVCAVDHTHQSLSAIDAQGNKVGLDKGYVRQILTASDSTPEKRAELSGLFAEWMDLRTADLAIILDCLIGPGTPELDMASEAMSRIDPTKIGVMGHSLGGAAAIALGRTRTEIKAVLALEAPYMGDVVGIKDGQFVFRNPIYPVPLLNLYTDSVGPRLSKLPQYAQNAAIAADNCNTTNDLYIRGAGHMTLTDLVYTCPPVCLLFGQDVLFDVTAYTKNFNQTCLDFFDSSLKGQGNFEPQAFERVAF